jgi:hypothetical protein
MPVLAAAAVDAGLTRYIMGPFRKWLSVLLTGAIVGACAGLLIKLLGSWLLPEEYWQSFRRSDGSTALAHGGRSF